MIYSESGSKRERTPVKYSVGVRPLTLKAVPEFV